MIHDLGQPSDSRAEHSRAERSRAEANRLRSVTLADFLRDETTSTETFIPSDPLEASDWPQLQSCAAIDVELWLFEEKNSSQKVHFVHF